MHDFARHCALPGERQSGYWFAAPWLFGFFVLTAGPLAASLALSFVKWDGTAIDEASWVGWNNYRDLVRIDGDHAPGDRDPWYWRHLGGKPADEDFYRSLYNTLYFSVFAVPLGLVTSLLMAVMLNARMRAMAFFRTVFYLPHVLGGVATILIWSWIFNPQFGPVNHLIGWAYSLVDPVVRLFGFAGTADWPLPGWLMSEAGCKPAVIIMSVWTAGGGVFIFLAALQQVDHTLYLAAQLDGASRWQRFLRITVPQITPAILFNLLTGLAASMQSFNQAYLLYNRAQNDGLLFYVLRLYRCAFEPPYRLGYASAMAWILFAILFVLALLSVLSGRRWVHYET